MDDADLNKITNTSITKTHEEILELLDEIKEFEKKYGEIEETTIECNIPENEYVLFEEIEPDLVIFKEIEEKKPEISKPSKKFKFNFIKKRKKFVTKKIEEPLKPTTFRLRINKEGVLENIDIKKPQSRKKLKLNFRLRKKEGKESKPSDGESKLSKIINVISKIKRIIPKREKEESEEPETNKET
ncbi:MAG: hypothetical protein AYK22_00155 [Thermoplasmatales archaeon SG8-52-3]|nr:MAG: hypothetical protein AYK22_00155 [Thermoplasmatales archaeon SG8-52-3]